MRDYQFLKEKTRQLRRQMLQMIYDAQTGHIGGSMSAAELLVALYYDKLNVDPQNPDWPDRDRFVLSKGHAVPFLYTILADRGYFNVAELKRFRQLHSILQGQPSRVKTPGIDACAGSLGQGLSMGVGQALGAKRAGKPLHVYVMLGDGEMDEGQIWEAAMSAVHYRLDNLTVILDNNGIQLDGTNRQIMDTGDLAEKMRVFGFDVIEVADGNDLEQVLPALDVPAVPGKPRCIVAHTVKGKGVSFMENSHVWHGKAPNAEQLARALEELA